MKENGLSRIAIVTRSNNEAKAIYEGLKQVLQKNVVFDDSETEFNNEDLINKINVLFGDGE